MTEPAETEPLEPTPPQSEDGWLKAIGIKRPKTATPEDKKSNGATRRNVLGGAFAGALDLFTDTVIKDATKGAGLAFSGAFVATGIDGYVNMSAEAGARIQLLSDALDLRMICSPTDTIKEGKKRLNEGFRVIYSNIIEQIKSDKSVTSWLLYHIGLPTDRINDTNSSTFTSSLNKSVGNGLGIFLEVFLEAVPGDDSYKIIRDAVVDRYPVPNPIPGEIDKDTLLVELDKIHKHQTPPPKADKGRA